MWPLESPDQSGNVHANVHASSEGHICAGAPFGGVGRAYGAV